MNENSTPVPQPNPLDPAPVAPYAPPPGLPDPQVGIPVSQPETRNPELGTGCAPFRMSGAQPGNQNARKHGLYSRYLPPKQRQDYEDARQIKGTGAERALLRCKLAEMLEKDPDNVTLVNKVINTIIKLEASRPETGNSLDRVAQNARNFFVSQQLPNPGGIVGEQIARLMAYTEGEE